MAQIWMQILFKVAQFWMPFNRQWKKCKGFRGHQAFGQAFWNVPTFREIGVSNFYPSSWFALLAPAGTPPEVVQKLNASVNKIIKDDTLKASLFDKFSLEAIGGSSETLRALMRSDTERMVPVVKDLGIKLD